MLLLCCAVKLFVSQSSQEALWSRALASPLLPSMLSSSTRRPACAVLHPFLCLSASEAPFPVFFSFISQVLRLVPAGLTL